MGTHSNLSFEDVHIFTMSDVEDNNQPEVSEEVEVSGDAPKGQMSVLDALKGVLKLALIHDGLVTALCQEHKIPLIKVPDGKQLGEWAGLCVLDREGNARKVVNCSCVVVKDWGEESQERSVLLNYFQTEQ